MLMLIRMTMMLLCVRCYSKVMTSSLSVEEVSYVEDSNIWIGPRMVSWSHLDINIHKNVFLLDCYT